MEINSKQLHKHAVPVVILLSGLLIVSTMALYSVGAPELSRGLTTRVINIKPPPPLRLDQAGQTAIENL